jgi:predicted RNase H-like nuclease
MVIAGIDLAWRSDKNPTALAIGRLDSGCITLESVISDLYGVESILAQLENTPGLQGIAIDGPLIINNPKGQRLCETLIGREYGARKASCHTSNTKLFRNADSVRLASVLLSSGYQHLGDRILKWQLECYPHPALIEVFGLPERHLYKKGGIEAKRRGQWELATLLLKLIDSKVLQMNIPVELSDFLSFDHIAALNGTKLKRNEDILDAVFCMYVGALYASGIGETIFGNVADGYIYVPTVRCV